MADITGKYDMTSSENFEKYMEAIGVGFMLRKVASATTNVQIELTKNGDEYTMKTVSKVRTTECKFKLNEEFTETTLDGREAKTTFTLVGNTLKQVQRGIKDADFVSTIDREFTSEGLTTTMKYKDVTAVRRYKRM